MLDLPEVDIEEETALTSWKNAPKLLDLKQDLDDARPAHDLQKTKVAEWLDNLNITGKAVVNTPKGNSKVVPKLIRKQAEWRYAALSEPFFSTEDVFSIKPTTLEDRKAAQHNMLVLNNQFNTKIDKTAFIDEYVRTTVDEGSVIVKVGWEFQEEEYEGDFPQVEFRINPDMAQLHEQLAQMRQESPSLYATDVPEELRQAHELTMERGEPIEPVVIGYAKETRTRIVKNHPTAEICDHRNVTFDPGCLGNIEKAGFAIYSFETSLSELKKDGKYKNLDKIQIDGDSLLSHPDHATSEHAANFNFADKPRKKFVVHEYWGFWDIDGNGTVKPIVVAWAGNTIIRMEENPFPDKALPFVVVQYLPVRKSIYGEPDGALLEDNQRIIGAVTRGMVDVLGKSANGQTGIRKDVLDATNRRKFDKGLDYEFNANVDPRQGIYMHVFPEIPQSAQFMLNLQNMEAESLTGVKSFSGGISGKGLGDVAAGVRGALDASSKRELGILRRLSAGMVKIARKFISMNAEFLSEEEVIRITDEEFVTVRRDDLAGKFDLRVTISTAEEDENKAKELAFMLQTMGNNMDPELSKMILADIARLRKMSDLAKKIENFQPQPDPIAQERAQLELELLRGQVEESKARAMRDSAAAQLNGAKVGTEGAKANQLKSDADLKNLDFVEQEQGVKQERDLQLHGEQARSQAQLKILDREYQLEDRKYDLLKEYVASKSK